MNELSQRARALLHATELADEPSQLDYDRGPAAVAARVAVGGAVGAAVTAVARTATAAIPASSVSASKVLGRPRDAVSSAIFLISGRVRSASSNMRATREK